MHTCGQHRICSLYGSKFYEIAANSVGLPKTVTLAVNAAGVHILERASLDLLSAFGYEDVQRWGYKSQMITFHMESFEISFKTKAEDAPEIAFFVEECIRRLVKKVEAGFT